VSRWPVTARNVGTILAAPETWAAVTALAQRAQVVAASVRERGTEAVAADISAATMAALARRLAERKWPFHGLPRDF
jgi:hypothetical protein